jgi:hypothetical protein
MAYDEQLAARIRHTLAARADMSERRMFGRLAFLRDGRMCCGVVGRNLMVRVVEDENRRFFADRTSVRWTLRGGRCADSSTWHHPA